MPAAQLFFGKSVIGFLREPGGAAFFLQNRFESSVKYAYRAVLAVFVTTLLGKKGACGHTDLVKQLKIKICKNKGSVESKR